jgi:hypothetical protein
MLAPVKIWVGLNNYRELFTSPTFGTIVWNTLVFTIASVLLTCILGLAFAMLLNMPVRKSALEDPTMVSYFEEFPQFKTAVEQLPMTQPQDSARVFVPNGDQIIGAGLERITVQSDDVTTAFADVQGILDTEAVPVVESLRAVEG